MAWMGSKVFSVKISQSQGMSNWCIAYLPSAFLHSGASGGRSTMNASTKREAALSGQTQTRPCAVCVG
eukprot:1341420-Rhodomonas_salina.1